MALKKLLAAAALSLTSLTTLAAPVTDNPGLLTAFGPVTAVFAFKQADDQSQLLAVDVMGTIFNNQTTAIGTSVNVGNVGPFPKTITFELKNNSQGYSFFTGIIDGPTGFSGVDGDEEWAAEVRRLADQRGATLLAHNYQLPAIQDVADHVGDSLALSRIAADVSENTIVFCGVHFMAETAKILSPDKTVLIPDQRAGCSLADSITALVPPWWLAFFPGLAITITVLAFNLLGDGIRDTLDPRLSPGFLRLVTGAGRSAPAATRPAGPALTSPSGKA